MWLYLACNVCFQRMKTTACLSDQIIEYRMIQFDHKRQTGVDNRRYL